MVDQTVITEKQARQTLPGKLPAHIEQKVALAKLPAKLELAVRTYTTAVAECMKIDDVKYWGDAAEALAAWAKINRDERVLRESVKMKKYALVRMAEIAIVEQPVVIKPRVVIEGVGRRFNGTTPGPRKLLQRLGISRENAANALRVARAPAKKKQQALNSGRGLAFEAVQFRGNGPSGPLPSSDSWVWITNSSSGLVRPYQFRARRAKDVAIGIDPGEVKKARALAIEAIEWFDEFEQYLPKSTEG